MSEPITIDHGKRQLLKALALICCTTPAAWANRLPAMEYQVLEDPEWGFSAPEKARLRHLIEIGLLEIELIARVAEHAGSRHLGWPVATRLPNGQTIVLYRRASGHTDQPSDGLEGHYVLHSDADGQFDSSQPRRIGPLPGMHTIGHVSRSDGSTRVIALTSGEPRRVYLSDDLGLTWSLQENALIGMLAGAVHVGPNFIRHPAFGLVACFGQETRGQRAFMVRTTDAGETWEQRTWLNPENARSVEPALATWGPGHMVMISREWNPDFATTPDGYYAHTQHVYRHTPRGEFKSVSFTTSRTNIIGNPAAGRSCHDTADVIFNPVTQRIEMLQSHRWGGGSGRTGQRLAESPQQEISSLNLWSIQPEKLLAGSADWRFDGTILERIGYSRRGNRDGLHPGGSIINVENGTQDIYVYAGWRRTPSSLYRIRRPLDTERLTSSL
ncbi:MAG: hypothetical protein RIG82_03315 [Phycisphaeraceae bacterium]